MQRTEPLSEKELDELLQLRDQPEKLISEIIRLKMEFPFNSEVFEQILLSLVNKKKVDILKACYQAALKNEDVFRVAHLVKQSLPEFDLIPVDTLLDMLSFFAEKMKNDMASGLLMDSIKNLAIKKPDVASDIERAILNRKDTKVYSYLCSIFLGVAEKNAKEALDKFLAIINTDEDFLKAVGLRGLCQLKGLTESEYSKIVQLLTENSSNPNVIVSANATFSLCHLSNSSEDIQKLLIELTLIGPMEVKYEISNYLIFKQGDLNKNFEECFLNLSSYDLSYHGITKSLDHVVYNLVTKSKFELVKKFFDKWISNHSGKEHREYKFDELFSFSIHEIITKDILFSDLMFSWLNSDDSKFHHCLSEVVSYAKAHRIRAPKLNEDMLKGLTYDDALYIVRKILGYIFSFEYSVVFSFSLLKSPIEKDKLKSLIGSVLVENLGYNYHRKMVDFLNSVSTSDEYNEFEKTVAKACRDELLRREKAQLKLPVINEILPKLDDQMKIRSAFQKRMSESMKEAQGKSPLLGMISRVTIKEGRSWFSYYNGQYSEPSKMSHFSEGIDLPKADVLDEVGASLDRHGFRTAKRGQT